MAGSNLSRCSDSLPIGMLVRSRSQELGISPAQLVRRAGFKNATKGSRRLEALLVGDIEGGRGLIAGLPAALEISTDVVTKAIEETKAQIHATKDAQWRSTFKPHAIIVTERKIPEPIFVAGIIGGERLLRVDFDLAAGCSSYVTQAVNGVRMKLAEFKNDDGTIPVALPAFGRPIGVVVNYAPDHAVRFDLDGRALKALPGAYRIRHTELLLAGREIPPGLLTSTVSVEA